MEENASTTRHPALLDLRGHFHLEPGLVIDDSTWRPDYPMEVFPVTDEQAILVRFQSTSLIDLPSQEILWTITCPALEAALDMERNLLALGAKGRVYLWDLQSGVLAQAFSLFVEGDIPTALAFHPHGLFLAIAPFADDIDLWRWEEGHLVYAYSLCSDDYACYKSLAFSPDGQFLASGNFESGKVLLWRMPDGQPVQPMEPPLGRVEGLAFSPDGKLLVAGNAGGDKKDIEMRVWDMQTKQAVQSFPIGNWHPTFSPDGKLLAAGDLHFIGIWDVANRKSIRFMPAHKGRFARLVFSPSGRILASIGDRQRTIRWWNVEDGREIYRMS